MGIKGKFNIDGLNIDERYIGNITGTLKVNFDLCESKANADDNKTIKRLTYKIPIKDNGELSKEAYKYLKTQIKGKNIKDVLEK